MNHDLVLEAGGLHILGTERHESRRIDNQLRGRSGRQGDPGSSRFYLSLEDDLMRIFGSDRISLIMQKLGMEEGQEIEHKMVSNAIARSQKRVEGHNFDIRKHLLEYDDVMNRQRMVIYELRNNILENKDISSTIKTWIDEIIESQILLHCEGANPNAWNINALNDWLTDGMGMNFTVNASDFKKGDSQLELFKHISENFIETYDRKGNSVGEAWPFLERNILLDILDHRWKDHLYVMDNLREGIWTVGYGDKNPLIEYKLQGFQIFDQMVENLKTEVINFLLRVEITEENPYQEEIQEYQRVGEEHLDIDIFNESFSNRTTLAPSRKKANKDVTTSAGGASKRKKNRRRKR